MKRAIKNVLRPYKAADSHKRRMQLQISRVRKAYHDDTSFMLASRLRSALAQFVRNAGTKKSGKTFSMVGKTPDQLLKYLESNTTLKVGPGVEVDHIFPLHKFNLGQAVQQRKSGHYSNLQLLTRFENAQKSDKLPTKAMAAKVDRCCWPDGVTEDMLPTIYPGWSSPLRM